MLRVDMTINNNIKIKNFKAKSAFTCKLNVLIWGATSLDCP